MRKAEKIMKSKREIPRDIREKRNTQKERKYMNKEREIKRTERGTIEMEKDLPERMLILDQKKMEICHVAAGKIKSSENKFVFH